MDPLIGSAEHQRQHKMLRDLYAVHERTKTAEEISFTLDKQYSYVAHICGAEPALAESNGMCETGLLTQGSQGGRPAALACRFHMVPTYFLLSMHATACNLPTFGPLG